MNAKAPVEIVKSFEKGYKYASKAISKPQELGTLVRDVGDRIYQANKDRCILNAVDTLSRRERGLSSKGPNVGKVVSFCLNEHLKPLLADKESGLVLVSNCGF